MGSMTILPACLQLGSTTIVPLIREGLFLGLGEIRTDGVPLRSGRLPMGIEIRSPDGVTLEAWRAVSCEARDGGYDIRLVPRRRSGGQMEWMLHTVRQRYVVSDWTQESHPADDTVLTLELRPASRTLDGRNGSGFTYRWRYRSESLAIYKLLDRGSWEPGGSASGCELWNRSAFVPSIARLGGRDDRYSTEWYLPGIQNPDIFQFVPLQTEMSGFTFTAGAGGVLATWADEVTHIRTLLEKPRGQDECLHLHEHCSDLGRELTTSPMTVLWFPRVAGRVDLANLHEAIRADLWPRLHAQVGMRPEHVTSYGIIEEWGLPDLDLYLAKAVPRMLEAGVKTVFIPSFFQNNMNTWGVQNICCTVDLKLSEQMNEQKFTAFCAALHAGGAKVEMWGNTAFASTTMIFDTDRDRGFKANVTYLPREDSVMEVVQGAEQPWVRNPSGAIEADHYTPHFLCANLRDPDMVAYWHKRWREARKKFGLDAIFLDSSFNLSSDKFHWIGQQHGHGGATADQTHLLGHHRPAIEPPRAILSQYRAHLAMMAEMQRYGYAYGNEDLGVFGIHRHGPGAEKRLDNLFLWRECVHSFDHHAVSKAGGNPDDVLFQGTAYRNAWSLYYDFANDCLSWSGYTVRDAGDRPTTTQLSWLAAFDACNQDMLGARHILPDESGVEYRGAQATILWSFRAQPVPLNGATAVDVITGERHTGILQATARSVYRIRTSSR